EDEEISPQLLSDIFEIDREDVHPKAGIQNRVLILEISGDCIHLYACLLKSRPVGEACKDKHLATIEFLQVALGGDVIRNPNSGLPLVGTFACGWQIEVRRKHTNNCVYRIVQR